MNKFNVVLFPFLMVWAFTMTATVAGQGTKLNSKHVVDINQAIDILSRQYVYDSQIDWSKLRSTYIGKARDIKTKFEFFEVLEQVVEELHDHHAHLDSNSTRSYRLAPSGLDVWGDYRNGQYVIDEVRPESSAEKAGLRGGEVLLKLNGDDVAVAVDKRLESFQVQQSDEAKSWAIRTLLAGRHEQKSIRVLVEKEDTVELEFEIGGSNSENKELLKAKVFDNQIHYVRINNSLGNNELVKHFDTFADQLSGKSKLILDLRDTPSGGNTMVARGLMGRLVEQDHAYQRHEFLEGQLKVPRVWVEHVRPRGKQQFSGPIAILVGRWTGSMGEGIAIGLDSRDDVTVIGNQMAGLKGATRKFRLSNSGLGFYLPVEKLFHTDGRPREKFVPEFYISPSSVSEETYSDHVLQAAMKLLNQH